MTASASISLLPEHFSARTALSPKSQIRLAVVALLLGTLIFTFPQTVLYVLTSSLALIYLVSTIDRVYLMLSGLRHPTLVSISDDEARALRDDELPYYTVLLPVYDEPSIVTNLINGVCQIEYPRDRLELLLLVEEDDLATREALARAPLQDVRLVLVPHSLPKTKPKACNYGMSLPDLKGEIVTIYDAEDIPDPLQLRRAALCFSRAEEDIGCLQARLGYFNETQNLLTRWFSLEYDQWFGVILPTVERERCVVPLGGTSNHIPTRVWREVGGWDEFNVTEDADLGVRLARHGYRTQILDSVTLEEANSDVVNWIRQRSRWYKGYLQTMIVHLRHPLELRHQIGTKAMFRLINMTGGIPIANFFNLIFGLLLASWIAGRPGFVALFFPPLTYYVSLLLFLIGAPFSVYVGFLLAQAIGKPYQWWAALLAPCYWILQSVAAVKALYQLIFRPFFWEKTVHGLSTPPIIAPTSTRA